jgi:hypothetical protein
VGKDYTQKESDDFFNTYSPIARLTTLRVLLPLATSLGLLVHQMDVKMNFLIGELEKIFIWISLMDLYHKDKCKVCRLLKSLYGLKQAPKQ